MPEAKSGLIPNAYNEVLGQKHGQARGAIRFAWSTNLKLDHSGDPILTRAQRRLQLRTIQINVNTIGQNIIIPPISGTKEIFELFMWNVGAQTLIWQQGTVGGFVLPLLQLTDYPALTQLSLPFNGSFEQPHWLLDNNAPLVLVTAAATQIDGYIRYRVNNGTS